MTFTHVPIVFEDGYVNVDNTLPNGEVSFIPTAPMRNGEVVISARRTFPIVAGQFPAGVTLAATDDVGTSPSGVAYRVVEYVGGTMTSYFIEVSKDDDEIDLGTVDRGQESPDPITTYQVLSAKGQHNGYAPLDGAGKVPSANLPTYPDIGPVVAEVADHESRIDVLEARPIIDSPDDIGAATASNLTSEISRATTAEGVLAGRATVVEGRATTLEGRATTLEARATAVNGSRLGRTPAKFRFIDSFDTGWATYYGTGTVAFDNTVSADGGSSLKLTLTSNEGLVGALKGITPRSFADEHFHMRIRSDDFTKVASMELQLQNGSGDNTTVFRLNLLQYIQHKPSGEWIDLAFTRQRFSTVGSPVWTAVDYMLVRATAVAGQTPNVWFDTLGSYEQATAGAVSLTFDDGWVSQYTEAMPRMAKIGYKGTAFVIPSTVGTTGYMTQQQVDGLHDAGWEIAGHGTTALDGLSAGAAETDVAAARAYLDAHGYRGREFYAYPEGKNTVAVRAIVMKHFSYARTVDFLNQPLTYIAPDRINAYTPIGSTTLGQITASIDSAVAGGEWLILGLHKQVSSVVDNSVDMTLVIFQGLLDYLFANAVPVMTVGEVMDHRPLIASELPTVVVPYDPYTAIETHVSFVEDFFNGATGTPFTATVANSGTSAAAINPFSYGEQGRVQVATGVNAAGASLILLTNTLIIGAGNGKLKFQCVVPVLSTGVEEFLVRIGYLDPSAAGGAPVDGMFLLYDRTVSVNWQAVSVRASTATTIDTGIPVDTNAFTTEILTTLAAGVTTVRFLINGVQVATTATNTPFTSGNPTSIGAQIVKSAGTTARAFGVDYFAWKQEIAR